MDKPAQFSAFQIARYFIAKANDEGRAITVLQLLKLVYISQGLHLVLNDGEPLFEEEIYAWRLGPVVVDLYHAYKRFGNRPIDEPMRRSQELENNPKVINELEKVWKKFGDWTGVELSNWTHIDGSPWDIVWNRQGGSVTLNSVISNKVIQEYFDSIVVKPKESQTAEANG